jgi:hypothetical protein
MKASSLRTRNVLRSLLVAVFISVLLPLAAQGKKVLAKDSSAVQLREPTPDAQKDLYEDEAWRYDRDDEATLGKDEPTVWDRLWNNFWEGLSDSLSGGTGSGPSGWTILMFLVLAAIIVLVILRVTNSGANSLFSGKAREQEKVDATLEDVDIHAIDFEAQIREAIARSDYRLATRLWFLRTLKVLSDKELLHWQIDKTNSDYYYELSGAPIQKDFGEVSNVYDHIWYGEFPLDESAYKVAEEKFKSLSGKIG